MFRLPVMFSLPDIPLEKLPIFFTMFSFFTGTLVSGLIALRYVWQFEQWGDVQLILLVLISSIVHWGATENHSLHRFIILTPTQLNIWKWLDVGFIFTFVLRYCTLLYTILHLNVYKWTDLSNSNLIAIVAIGSFVHSQWVENRFGKEKWYHYSLFTNLWRTFMFFAFWVLYRDTVRLTVCEYLTEDSEKLYYRCQDIQAY